jgi:formate C-acetyltransferase
MVSAQASFETQSASSPWRGFTPGTWQSRVNVREFIQCNYTPYEGDSTFLQGVTERTQGLWQKLQPLLALLREQRHTRRVADPLRYPRARARLHRQGP